MMSPRITRVATVCLSIVCTAVYACQVTDEETSTEEQAGSNLQGSNLQGSNLQGSNLQGMTLQGFRIDGATLGGAPLTNLRVERGEVIADQGGVTLRGASLAGAQLQAQARSTAVNPPVTTTVQYRITAIAPEDPAYDPTQTGSTYLYTLEQWGDGTGVWQPACPADQDGRRVAIPLAATWDEHGDRIESSTLFTFGCTTGVLAKCYRWGYRPWLTGYGANMAEMHWTCTRMARADYCGNGVSNTQDDTWVNVWDNLPAPGPIQRHGLLPPLGMLFEAGWGPHGAVCLSHARWLSSLGSLIAGMCPDRLVPPGLGGIACNTVLDVLVVDPTVKLFNESYINLGL
jgi:ADYC domain/Pentapeptide repeats (8 copies)